ncbi:hypothetical protein ACA910_001856 [Epithemia clementina (nom. ined.)]
MWEITTRTRHHLMIVPSYKAAGSSKFLWFPSSHRLLPERSEFDLTIRFATKIGDKPDSAPPELQCRSLHNTNCKLNMTTTNNRPSYHKIPTQQQSYHS